MAIVYADTSALLRLVIQEPGSDLVDRLWDGADAVMTSRLADPEMSALIAAAVRADRLGQLDAHRARELWQTYKVGLRWVEVTPTITEMSAELVDRHVLRAGDAVHLASAMALAGDPGHPTDLVVAVWDTYLASAAEEEGLRVLPGRSLN